MQDYYQNVKNYLLEINYNITHENPNDNIIMVSKESQGIKNLILGIAYPILIMEQHILFLEIHYKLRI